MEKAIATMESLLLELEDINVTRDVSEGTEFNTDWFDDLEYLLAYRACCLVESMGLAYRNPSIAAVLEQIRCKPNDLDRDFLNYFVREEMCMMMETFIIECNEVLETRKAADDGDMDAQYEMAIRMINGELVERSMKGAQVYLERSANQGHPIAQSILCNWYLSGIVVEKSLEKAFELATKSAEQGYVESEYTLGWMYENGQGVEKDLSKAMELYKEAAAKGHLYAQQNLEIMESSQEKLD